jgi:hypothetical protein
MYNMAGFSVQGFTLFSGTLLWFTPAAQGCLSGLLVAGPIYFPEVEGLMSCFQLMDS